MAMLCNKKVTHTQTISNAIGYSMYTWKASLMETPTSVAAPLPRMSKQFYDILFLSQIKPILCQFTKIVIKVQVRRDSVTKHFFVINSS